MAVVSPAEPDSHALRAMSDTPMTLFSDVRTIGALAALTPIEFAARYLEVSQRSLRQLHAEEDTNTLGSELRTYKVIGHVTESDSLAHVLYRTTDAEIMQNDSHSAAILYLRRRGSEWRLLLPADLAPLPFTFWLSRDF